MYKLSLPNSPAGWGFSLMNLYERTDKLTFREPAVSPIGPSVHSICQPHLIPSSGCSTSADGDALPAV